MIIERTSWSLSWNVLTSSTPLICSVSCMCAASAPSSSWAALRTRNVASPTRRVGSTNSGRSSSDSVASRQLSRYMTITVVTTVAVLEISETKVSVTTDCTPATSLVSRDITSPVWVPVNQRIGIASRRAYSRLRRPNITRWPTTVVRYVCSTETRPAASGAATIRTTSRSSRAES